MRNIRFMDNLVDELAKGRSMEKDAILFHVDRCRGADGLGAR
jgi:hypothetical protein